MKNRHFDFKKGLCALAVLGVATAFAQEEEAADAAPAAENAPAQTVASISFRPLVRARRVRGQVQASLPGGAIKTVEIGKMYPLGSTFTTGPDATLALGISDEEQMILGANSTVAVLGTNETSRTIHFTAGRIRTLFRDNVPEGAIDIDTPDALLQNVCGKGEYSLDTAGETSRFRASTITGSAKITGAQFTIPALRAANILVLDTAADKSLSRIFAESGEYAIVLDKGAEDPCTYKMTPHATVKIWRQHAKVGGRLIVSTLVLDAKGFAEHRFAYAEGRPEVATGELTRPKEETAGEGGEELPVLVDTPKEGENDAEEPASEE